MGDDAGLIGWRTRLVQRIGEGTHLATTITPSQPAAPPSPNTAVAKTISQALQKHIVPHGGAQILQPDGPVGSGSDQRTDMLVRQHFSTPPVASRMYQLHQLWDPMMLQEQASSNDDALEVSTCLRKRLLRLTIQSPDLWNWDPIQDRSEGKKWFKNKSFPRGYATRAMAYKWAEIRRTIKIPKVKSSWFTKR